MPKEPPEQLQEHQFESQGKGTSRGKSQTKGIIFDNDLLEDVDALAKEQGKSRSEVVREVLRENIKK